MSQGYVLLGDREGFADRGVKFQRCSFYHLPSVPFYPLLSLACGKQFGFMCSPRQWECQVFSCPRSCRHQIILLLSGLFTKFYLVSFPQFNPGLPLYIWPLGFCPLLPSSHHKALQQLDAFALLSSPRVPFALRLQSLPDSPSNIRSTTGFLLVWAS